MTNLTFAAKVATILPHIVRPGRFASVEWRNAESLPAASGPSVALITPSEYERAVNDPRRVVIENAIRGAGVGELGTLYSVDQDTRAIFASENIPAFTIPRLRPLASAKFIFVYLERPARLAEACELLQWGSISPERSVRTAGISVFAICADPLWPEIFSQVFNRVFALDDFLALIAQGKQMAELCGDHELAPNRKSDRPRIIPSQQIIPAVECQSYRARYAFLRPVLCPADVNIDCASSVATIVSSYRDAGVVDIQFEGVGVLPKDDSFAEILTSVGAEINPSLIGLSVTGLRAEQITPELARTLARYRRLRLEFRGMTSAEAVGGGLGETIDALARLSVANIASIGLTITLGHYPDADSEVVALSAALKNTQGRISIPPGLKIRFSPRRYDLFSENHQGTVCAPSEISERFSRIERQGRVRGIQQYLDEGIDSYADTMTAFGAWPSIGDFLTAMGQLRQADRAAREAIICNSLETNRTPTSALTHRAKARFGNDENAGSDLQSFLGMLKSAQGSAQEKINVRPTSQGEKVAPDKRPHLATSVTTSNGDFGRAKKKSPLKTTLAPTKSRLRFVWGKDNRARFLSHLDNARVIEAALVRSQTPVSYSQGPKPRLRVSYGPPLPLGFTSECELFEAHFETLPTSDQLQRVKDSLPEGFTIKSVQLVYSAENSISAEITRATYDIAISNDTLVHPPTATQEMIARFLDRSEVVIERDTKSGAKKIDLRPGIFHLQILESPPTTIGGDSDYPTFVSLELTASLCDDLYVRPEEALWAAGLISERRGAGVRIHRRELIGATLASKHAPTQAIRALGR